MELSGLFFIGIAILAGYVGGYIANRLKLPRVSGYIVVGMLLSPTLLKVFPSGFVSSSQPITDFALSIVTYLIGGSLAVKRIKRLGKTISWITLLEAETAFVLMIIVFTFLLPVFLPGRGNTLTFYLPFALLMGAMASPTDPVASIAVIHEYRADGPLTTTLLGVAAGDDATGIMNFSIATSIAVVLTAGSKLNVKGLVFVPIYTILSSIVLGLAVGYLIYISTKKIYREGAVISIVIGYLVLAYSVADFLRIDPLLTTMSAGAMVVNMTHDDDKMFGLLEKYYEELIFIVFFVIGSAHLQLSVLKTALLIILVFVIVRALGKFLGTYIGAKISHAPDVIKKYLAFGLFPQGGIVVGLALTISRFPQFHKFSLILVNIILGTTVLHELLGPIASKVAITKSGEITKKQREVKQND